MSYNPRKAAQTIAFFTLKNGGVALDMLKAIKLVYLADRESLAAYGFPIQSEPRVSMRHGPVNSETYNFLKGEVRDVAKAPWAEFLASIDGNKVSLSSTDIVASDLDELSDADLSMLEATWDKFGSYETWALVDWTHDTRNVPEWEDPGDSSRIIPLRRMMQAVGVHNPEAQSQLVSDQKDINLLFERLS